MTELKFCDSVGDTAHIELFSTHNTLLKTLSVTKNFDFNLRNSLATEDFLGNSIVYMIV